MGITKGKRILMLGIGPLPSDNTTKIHGSCFRTAQFIDPLLDDGHVIRLVAMRITGLEERFETEVFQEQGKLSYYSVDEVSCFRNDEYLQRHHDAFQPDGIIGVNAFPSTCACKLRTQAPIWADINGYSMGEAQTKAFKERNDFYVLHNWRQEKPALERADKFSSASDLQRHILVGELGAVGRLNQYTMGYELVHTVPEGRKDEGPLTARSDRTAMGLPQDALLILWSGGFNLWCDVETMFQGLERAMARDPRICFVSTGGSIDGVDEQTYPCFQALAAQSRFRDRFHLEGWIPFEQVPDYFLNADVGINVDALCYESRYGARNRITDMMKAGLPILTTLGTEISRIVEDARCGITFPIGNVEALASAIGHCAAHSEELKAMGQKGREYFQKYYTFEETTKPVRLWASNPRHSPDWDKPKPVEPPPAPPNEEQQRPRKWWSRLLSH